jgi:hypothetical protein
MRNTTLLFVLAAIAATSCSLQIDSQYGMRWEQRHPEQRHRRTEYQPISAQAATSPVTLELPASPSWSNAELPHREEYHAANAAPLIGLELHSQAVNAPVPNERPTARTSAVSDDAHRMSPVLENQDKAQRNVLLKILGLLLMALGTGLLTFVALGVVVISAYGADLVGILYLLLFAAIGIALVYVGSILSRRF